jgi:hypothetical protein
VGDTVDAATAHRNDIGAVQPTVWKDPDLTRDGAFFTCAC